MLCEQVGRQAARCWQADGELLADRRGAAGRQTGRCWQTDGALLAGMLHVGGGVGKWACVRACTSWLACGRDSGGWHDCCQAAGRRCAAGRQVVRCLPEGWALLAGMMHAAASAGGRACTHAPANMLHAVVQWVGRHALWVARRGQQVDMPARGMLSTGMNAALRLEWRDTWKRLRWAAYMRLVPSRLDSAQALMSSANQAGLKGL
jgi:hypothetical protein